MKNKFMAKVMKRDGFECCLCGSKNGLKISRIIKPSIDREKEFLERNAITLCGDCFIKAHTNPMLHPKKGLHKDPAQKYEIGKYAYPKRGEGLTWPAIRREVQKKYGVVDTYNVASAVRFYCNCDDMEFPKKLRQC